MKANELTCKDLMVGDCVFHRKYGNVIIESIDNDFGDSPSVIVISENIKHKEGYTYGYMLCGLEDIFPIPLTPEILENNGFHEEWDEDIKLMVCDSIIVEIGNNYKLYTDGKMYLHRVLAPLYYVHQLQHALRLCNIEKEIIL